MYIDMIDMIRYLIYCNYIYVLYSLLLIETLTWVIMNIRSIEVFLFKSFYLIFNKIYINQIYCKQIRLLLVFWIKHVNHINNDSMIMNQ